MNLQISPFGLMIASPFYVLALWLLRKLWKRQGNSPWRWSAVALVPAVIALPYADEIWIAWHFKQACKDAGVHVMRKVEVDGFYDETGNWGRSAFSKTAYQFIEFKEAFGPTILRLERINGSFKLISLDHPLARYFYKFSDLRQEVPIGLKLEKLETQVFDSLTNEVIARDIRFNRYPGFIEGLWIHFLGRGQTICARPLDDHEQKVPTGMLYDYALIPANKQ